MNYKKLAEKFDFWLAYWGKTMPSRNTYGNYGIWQYGGESNLWQATDTYLSHTLVQSTPLQSLHLVLQASSSHPHKFFTVQCLTLPQSFPLG